jgi:hypothetical protein
MKMKYWSEHEKYIVMVDGGKNHKSVQGVNIGYQAFLDFKRVKEALISLSKRPEGNYSLDDNIYKRLITTSRASQILMKIENCRWDDDIRTVAKQIKAGDMLSPVKHGNLKALYELSDTEKLDG